MGGLLRTAAVQGHAGRPDAIVALPGLLLDELLRGHVAGCEEDGGRDALCEQWAGRQLGPVPVRRISRGPCAAARQAAYQPSILVMNPRNKPDAWRCPSG